jgi:Rap1a immunity proteins
MKPANVIVAFLVSLTICGTARAQATTGQQIQNQCKALVGTRNPSDAFDGGFCPGFIDGVINSQSMWEANDKLLRRNHPQSFCLPQEGTNGEYLQVFVKYLDDHPEELHKPAALLLVQSLIKAFPCGK